MLITKFIEKKIEKSTDTLVKAKFVYLAYRKFLENTNSIPLKYMDFRQTLGEMGINCINLGNVYFFENITLIEAEDKTKLLDIAKAYYHLK